MSKTVDQPIQAQQSQSVLHESEPKPEPEPEPASVVEDKSFNKTAIKNGALTATPGAVLIIVPFIVMLLTKDWANYIDLGI